MPVHPQIQQFLDKGAGVPATHTLSVADARAQYEARIALMAEPAPVAGVEERVIAGPEGDELRLRLYRPDRQGRLPVVVFYHGSGFVLCSLDTHDGMCRNLTAGAGCLVVSVDYRLAPEHPFPAGLHDCVHATRWVAQNAEALGADPAQIAIAGDSAGGNLVAAAALVLRDEGGPMPMAQVLIYPATDHYSAGWPSYERCRTGYGLGPDTMRWFWDHYLPDRADAAKPYVSPYRAPSLEGLPPAFVATAEYDPLCDEGEAFAGRLTEAGIPTLLRRYEGMNHGFLYWVGIIDVADAAMRDICAWLRERQSATAQG